MFFRLYYYFTFREICEADHALLLGFLFSSLNYVEKNHGRKIIAKINRALSENKYSDNLFVACRSKNLAQLRQRCRKKIEKAEEIDANIFFRFKFFKCR